MTLETRLDDLDAALVDGFQSGFPIVERPFRDIGERLNATESTVLDRIRRLDDDGLFRRVGAVLNPPVIGSSALAAARVADERFDEIAEFVNGYDRVNHNYRRAHAWNMWFVVTAESLGLRDRILEDIGAVAGDLLVLPLRTEFYINLEFPVVNDDRWAREDISETPVSPTPVSETAVHGLPDLEARLVLEIQDGFPLTRTPYADIAANVGADATDVIAALGRLREWNCIKRIGCVVDHRTAGFDANAMVVWDVPDGEIDDRGVTAGRRPYVTYCCHRPRRPAQDWPYTLFTMIHARDRAALESRIDALATGPLPFDHARLHTVESLKQTGVRYRDLLGRGDTPREVHA